MNNWLVKPTADQVQTYTPITVRADLPLPDTAALPGHKVGGRPIGIITGTDFFRLFATQLAALTGESARAPDPRTAPPLPIGSERTDR